MRANFQTPWVWAYCVQPKSVQPGSGPIVCSLSLCSLGLSICLCSLGLSICVCGLGLGIRTQLGSGHFCVQPGSVQPGSGHLYAL